VSTSRVCEQNLSEKRTRETRNNKNSVQLAVKRGTSSTVHLVKRLLCNARKVGIPDFSRQMPGSTLREMSSRRREATVQGFTLLLQQVNIKVTSGGVIFNRASLGHHFASLAIQTLRLLCCSERVATSWLAGCLRRLCRDAGQH
jgi:hypothetical protein